MIKDYFEFIKNVATKNSSVKKIRLIREFIGVQKGFIRFVIELRDDSELHIFEYLDSSAHRINYSSSNFKKVGSKMLSLQTFRKSVDEKEYWEHIKKSAEF